MLENFKTVLIIILLLYQVLWKEVPTIDPFKAVGDIIELRPVPAYNYQTGQYDFTSMFQPVKEALQADILVGT